MWLYPLPYYYHFPLYSLFSMECRGNPPFIYQIIGINIQIWCHITLLTNNFFYACGHVSVLPSPVWHFRDDNSWAYLFHMLVQPIKNLCFDWLIIVQFENNGSSIVTKEHNWIVNENNPGSLLMNSRCATLATGPYFVNLHIQLLAIVCATLGNSTQYISTKHELKHVHANRESNIHFNPALLLSP